MSTPEEAFSVGVMDANALDPRRKDVPNGEQAEVKQWHAEIREASAHDEEAVKQYAKDRQYARGGSSEFEVQVPIGQSYIDVLRSFVYAKDPDVTVTPSGMTEPPPHKEIEEIVEKDFAADQKKMVEGIKQGMAQGGAPPDAAEKLPKPPPISDDELQARVAELLAPYKQKRDDATQLAKTLELVISVMWERAELKVRMKQMVNSAMTVGVGWIKAMWVERQGKDPTVMAEIRDIRDHLTRIAALHEEIAEGEADDLDRAREQYRIQLESLKAKVNITIDRGFVIDFVAAQDMQVSVELASIDQYKQADWIAQKSFYTYARAKAEFGDLIPDEVLKTYTPWFPVKPKSQDEGTELMTGDLGVSDAQTHTKGGANQPHDGSTITAAGASKGSVCVREIWDQASGTVFTLIDGINRYAKPPQPIESTTTRMLPYFQICIGTTDGLRHPRSLINRSAKLFDEYASCRSNFRRTRRRAVPRIAYDRTNFEPAEVARIEAGEDQEIIGLKPIRPGTPIRDAFVEVQYARVDPALYDTQPIRAELEMTWGVQEALSSSIQTSKTATEAEISKAGTNSRNGYIVDEIDDMMSDLGRYTAETLLHALSPDDVKEIAGPWSMWPEGMDARALASLVSVKIRAGSTGKPNTTQAKQNWAQLLPIMQAAIQQIGQLRGSSNEEIADCMEALINETANRTGEQMDVFNLMPDPPRNPPPPQEPPTPPIVDSALAGPQIIALLDILVDVKSGVLPPESAKGLIKTAFPHVPDEIVGPMVDGATPQPGQVPVISKRASTQQDAGHIPGQPIPAGSGMPISPPDVQPQPTAMENMQ